MKYPSTWVLAAVADFPATGNTLAGIAEKHGAKDGVAVVRGLVSEGRLAMIGTRKHAKYVLPSAIAKLAKRRRG